MKHMRSFFLASAILCFQLISCATADAIVIENKSSQPKRFVAHYPSDLKFPKEKDSLQAWDLTVTENSISVRDRYRNSLRLPATADTARRTVSFLMQGKHELTFYGSRTSLSTVRKLIVIADHDTLKFHRKGNCWTYTIGPQ